jgi:thiol-disulfide isomerase/thioredoxin
MVSVLALGGLAACLYFWNATPAVPSVPAAEAVNPTRPYVVKLHAQWCPVCLTTTSIWSQIEAAYGNRVNLVVFDFTNEATTVASEAEARRLGLEQFFA